MESALEETDHERVPRNARAQVIGERASEVLSATRAERFTGAKPDEGTGLEPLPKCRESRKQRVRARECATVEALAVDQRAPPLSMAPELKLRDALLGRELGEKLEGIRPVSRAIRGVDAPEPSIKVRAGLPSDSERTRRTNSLCSVVYEKTQRGHELARKERA